MNKPTVNQSIVVLGAGNSGLAMAAYLSSLGLKVRLWNRTAEHIHKIADRKMVRSTGVLSGEFALEMVTDNLELALKNAGLVFVTTPADSHAEIAHKAASFLNKNHTLILNPGRTWGAVVFKEEAFMTKNTFFSIAETQTILFTCRKAEEDLVNIITFKKDILMSTLGNKDVREIIVQLPLDMQKYFIPAGSFLETSLGNIGMILHCAPVVMNVGWIENETAEFKYYYEGITRSVAHFLEKMDTERIMVARKLGCFTPGLKEWIYRSYNVSGNDLYSTIKKVQAYETIDAPNSIKHRYLFEDVATGLVPLEYIGNEIGLEMKCTALIIDLASQLLDIDFRQRGRRLSLAKIRSYL